MALDRRLGDVYISIHAPREGSDGYAEANSGKRWKFLSTLPARGATTPPKRAARSRSISIHAPREGSDAGGNGGIPIKSISIHAPREGSDYWLSSDVPTSRLFLSTLPARGATKLPDLKFHYMKFLSTLPARGATSGPARSARAQKDFYPRSPRGERPVLLRRCMSV